MGTPRITLIAAVAANGGLGNQGGLLVRLPEDMAWFKAHTLGKPVVMGRTTYESLPARARPLPERTNIVLTRNAHYTAPGATIAGSMEEVLSISADAEELMVAGGAEIYAQFLPRADKLLITEVDISPEADVFFPEFDKSSWQKTVLQSGSQQDVKYRFVVYERQQG